MVIANDVRITRNPLSLVLLVRHPEEKKDRRELLSSDNSFYLATASLLNESVNSVTVLHLELTGCLVAIESLAVIQEANSLSRKRFSLAISIHKLTCTMYNRETYLPKRGRHLELKRHLFTLGVLHLELNRFTFFGS